MELAELQALEERYLMQTYKRAPVEFVRGEGATLWDAEGRPTSTSSPGSRSARSGTATRPWSRRCASRPGA